MFSIGSFLTIWLFWLLTVPSEGGECAFNVCVYVYVMEVQLIDKMKLQYFYERPLLACPVCYSFLPKCVFYCEKSWWNYLGVQEITVLRTGTKPLTSFLWSRAYTDIRWELKWMFDFSWICDSTEIYILQRTALPWVWVKVTMKKKFKSAESLLSFILDPFKQTVLARKVPSLH